MPYLINNCKGRRDKVVVMSFLFLGHTFFILVTPQILDLADLINTAIVFMFTDSEAVAFEFVARHITVEAHTHTKPHIRA